MEKFLKKYMSKEQLNELLEKYKADGHADATSLPEFISKGRLDEEIGKKKGFETQVNTLKAQIEAFGAEKEKAVNDAVAAAKAEAKAHEDEAISAVKKDFEVTEAIYNAKGKNVKAIKALIDPSKPVAEELERIQKSDSYLFGSSEGDIPGGTGKSGGDPASESDKEKEAMRRAVGGLY